MDNFVGLIVYGRSIPLVILKRFEPPVAILLGKRVNDRDLMQINRYTDKVVNCARDEGAPSNLVSDIWKK